MTTEMTYFWKLCLMHNATGFSQKLDTNFSNYLQRDTVFQIGWCKGLVFFGSMTEKKQSSEHDIADSSTLSITSNRLFLLSMTNFFLSFLNMLGDLGFPLFSFSLFDSVLPLFLAFCWFILWSSNAGVGFLRCGFIFWRKKNKCHEVFQIHSYDIFLSFHFPFIFTWNSQLLL